MQLFMDCLSTMREWLQQCQLTQIEMLEATASLGFLVPHLGLEFHCTKIHGNTKNVHLRGPKRFQMASISSALAIEKRRAASQANSHCINDAQPLTLLK